MDFSILDFACKRYVSKKFFSFKSFDFSTEYKFVSRQHDFTVQKLEVSVKVFYASFNWFEIEFAFRKCDLSIRDGFIRLQVVVEEPD